MQHQLIGNELFFNAITTMSYRESEHDFVAWILSNDIHEVNRFIKFLTKKELIRAYHALSVLVKIDLLKSYTEDLSTVLQNIEDMLQCKNISDFKSDFKFYRQRFVQRIQEQFRKSNYKNGM